MITQKKILDRVVYLLLVITMAFMLVATGTQICYGSSNDANAPAQSNSSLNIKLETPATPVDTIVPVEPTVPTAPTVSTEVVPETPMKTGDDNNLSVYIGILAISACAIVILRKKEANFKR
jgi:LPXTG-motif cell wall-anchored protein